MNIVLMISLVLGSITLLVLTNRLFNKSIQLPTGLFFLILVLLFVGMYYATTHYHTSIIITSAIFSASVMLFLYYWMDYYFITPLHKTMNSIDQVINHGPVWGAPKGTGSNNQKVHDVSIQDQTNTIQVMMTEIQENIKTIAQYSQRISTDSKRQPTIPDSNNSEQNPPSYQKSAQISTDTKFVKGTKQQHVPKHQVFYKSLSMN